MAHPMVEQLRFTRREFVRCLDGLSLQDAYVRHGQMNCISWTIGHLASHENGLFVYLAQGIRIQPDLRAICGYGSPPSAPKLDDMWDAWREVTACADVFLDTLTTETLQARLEHRGQPVADFDRLAHSARHLPLLVSPGRVARDPPNAGTSRSAAVRR